MYTPNVNLLADWLENFEPKYGVDVFDMRYTKEVLEYDKLACCVQGCAAALFGNINGMDISDIRYAVKHQLGLTEDQHYELCYPLTDDVDLNDRIYHCTPQEAAKVVRNLLKTGEVD